ncbi:MBL fold metallo-hydrolase [Alkalimarinus alittae]|uniref:MBL fold metallo-hydrolase n=1 Tax=Alkalimarinus alittae TaxID=2961619 RepID=A0ABY6N1S4_9ALTE|nr:MBL fold metallo-hydrolase [Alkalimarinus alittae]UZE96068.1 MBL fold metallo-hydrolase [Alkalimarinus alittae]
MKRTFFSLILMICGLVLSLLATAFYLFNYKEPLEGFDQTLQMQTVSNQGNQLTATFIGTSTLLFSDGDSAIMIDGFFTRPTIKTLLWKPIQPDIPLIKSSLKRLNITQLKSVIVAHSHHDHAMDAPIVAQLTGATLFGSGSTANIARASGLAETQIEVVGAKRTLSFGQFKVTMIKSKHTPVPAAMAWLTGHGKDISQPLPPKPRLTDFKEGGSYAVHIKHPLGNILVQASGGYISGLLEPYQADVVFLGVAGLSKQSEQFKHDYFKETLHAVGAIKVIPIHWDNFMRPIGKALVPAHPLIDNIEQSITDLADYMHDNEKGSLIMMQAWDTITLY